MVKVGINGAYPPTTRAPRIDARCPSPPWIEPRASTPIVGEQTSRCPRLTIDRPPSPPPRPPPRFRSHRTPRVPPRVRPPRVRVCPHQRVPRRGRILRVPRQVRLGPRTVAERLRLRRREHRRRRQSHLVLHALHPWGRAVGPTRRRARAGVQRRVPDQGHTQRLLHQRGQEGARVRASQGEGRSRPEHRVRSEPRQVRSREGPHRHRRIVHHKLPRPGRRGGPEEPRHRPRVHHHHPQRDKHPNHRRRAKLEEIRSSPSPLWPHQPRADIHRVRHRHRAHLPGAQG